VNLCTVIRCEARQARLSDPRFVPGVFFTTEYCLNRDYFLI
jgi:hypothetical protein